MSYSFKSLAGTGVHISGHDDVDENGNPTGGHAVDTDGDSNYGGFRIDRTSNGTLHLSGECKAERFRITWQNGPINRARNDVPNGAFVEDVLEVCRRRLEHYEKSTFACKENAEAIGFITGAIAVLTDRRRDRASRGVQGKYEK